MDAMPTEPPPSRWVLPDPTELGEGDLVGVGADLEPGTLLAAYRNSIFPMPIDGKLGWWCPERRAIIPVERLKVSRSLRRSTRRYEVRLDTAFDEVVTSCADPARPGGWISDGISAAYRRLHSLGWAHSVEAWDGGGRLAGGLYGVAIGGLFAGESMFHRQRDASKVALVGLIDLLATQPGALLDVQWLTPHLTSLGAVEVSRDEYLARLGAALEAPLPSAFAVGQGVGR
jgi:leucyl/phenylalanyl-tRNA--protein transferase